VVYLRQWRSTRWQEVAVAWSRLVTINSRRRSVARAIWIALLESPVASARVRTLAVMGFHFFRTAWP
jgi:hypothetical protein